MRTSILPQLWNLEPKPTGNASPKCIKHIYARIIYTPKPSHIFMGSMTITMFTSWLLILFSVSAIADGQIVPLIEPGFPERAKQDILEAVKIYNDLLPQGIPVPIKVIYMMTQFDPDTQGDGTLLLAPGSTGIHYTVRQQN